MLYICVFVYDEAYLEHDIKYYTYNFDYLRLGTCEMKQTSKVSAVSVINENFNSFACGISSFWESICPLVSLI